MFRWPISFSSRRSPADACTLVTQPNPPATHPCPRPPNQPNPHHLDGASPRLPCLRRLHGRRGAHSGRGRQRAGAPPPSSNAHHSCTCLWRCAYLPWCSHPGLRFPLCRTAACNEIEHRLLQVALQPTCNRVQHNLQPFNPPHSLPPTAVLTVVTDEDNYEYESDSLTVVCNNYKAGACCVFDDGLQTDCKSLIRHID